jgi:hypothetical protein
MPTITDQLTQAMEWHKSGRLPEVAKFKSHPSWKIVPLLEKSIV